MMDTALLTLTVIGIVALGNALLALALSRLLGSK